MFLTFINSNVKNVNLFGNLEKLYYFCGVRKYKKKRVIISLSINGFMPY